MSLPVLQHASRYTRVLLQRWLQGLVVTCMLAMASTLPVVHAGPAAQASAQDADALALSLQAQRKAEHERINAERAALQVQRQSDEAACYQRFLVEDCLRGVRTQVREAEARLRHREMALNDAERKEKAAERLRAIEEKRGAAPPASAGVGVPGATLRPPSRAPDSGASRAQKDKDAERRALAQRDRVQAQAQEQSARNANNAERAAKARDRQAKALKAADERRARVEKARADAAAAGHVPAAPLPVAPAAR